MITAINQPYFFPYIGYFQMAAAVDVFVFYDGVTFIKKGWINRNNILINGSNYLFTVPCREVSQNKLINEIYVDDKSPDINKIKKTICHNYNKAPYFEEVCLIIDEVFSSINSFTKISELSIMSIEKIFNYLGIDFQYVLSSELSKDLFKLTREEKIIAICKKMNADTYYNLMGGMSLYDKKIFKSNGISLRFLRSRSTKYTQFNNKFVDNLSIIDVLMFNSKEQIRAMLKNYTLV